MSLSVPTALAAEIQRLEQMLHDPAVRADASHVEALLCEDFAEFGSSGRRFDLESVLGLLAAERGADVRYEASDFEFARVGEDAILVTYRTQTSAAAPGAQAGDPAAVRHSLRSSLWLRRAGRWRMRFHQGTLTTPV